MNQHFASKLKGGEKHWVYKAKKKKGKREKIRCPARI
jgi:hypothetical protein